MARSKCRPTSRSAIRSSLGYLTPAEFEEQWQKEQALALDLN